LNLPRNDVYGFRTDLTRSNTEIWYQANSFLGWALVAGSAASAGVLAMLPETANKVGALL
jgi:hypothetical protein